MLSAFAFYAFFVLFVRSCWNVSFSICRFSRRLFPRLARLQRILRDFWTFSMLSSFAFLVLFVCSCWSVSFSIYRFSRGLFHRLRRMFRGFGTIRFMSVAPSIMAFLAAGFPRVSLLTQTFSFFISGSSCFYKYFTGEYCKLWNWTSFPVGLFSQQSPLLLHQFNSSQRSLPGGCLFLSSCHQWLSSPFSLHVFPTNPFLHKHFASLELSAAQSPLSLHQSNATQGSSHAAFRLCAVLNELNSTYKFMKIRMNLLFLFELLLCIQKKIFNALERFCQKRLF